MFNVENVTPAQETTRKSLKDRAKEFSAQLVFMGNRKKGNTEEVIGQYITIRDFGFLVNDKGADYVAFIVDEDPEHFFFGGQVLTDQMHRLDDEGYADEIRADGLPVLMTEKKSKNGRNYTNVEFFPE